MFIIKKFKDYPREVRLRSLSLTLIKIRTEFLRIVITIWAAKGEKACIIRFQQGIIKKDVIKMLLNTLRLVLNANIGMLGNKKSLFSPLPQMA